LKSVNGEISIIFFFQNLLTAEHPYQQLGGNETVGMGWCISEFSTHGENDEKYVNLYSWYELV